MTGALPATWRVVAEAVLKCEPRYRLGAAIGHAFGFGEGDYGNVVQLVIDMKYWPERAADYARSHAEWASPDACKERQWRLADVAIALEGVEFEVGGLRGDACSPAELLEALTVYCQALHAVVATREEAA